MGATSKETHGILDELISTIPDSDIHVLFTETEDGGLKASIRSSPAIDVSRLAAETYGGGGHARAAGFKVRPFSNFQLQTLECVQMLKVGMERQRAEGEMLSSQALAEEEEADGQGRKGKKGKEGRGDAESKEGKKGEDDDMQAQKKNAPKGVRERDILEDLADEA